MLLIRNARIIDGTGNAPLQGASILVEDGRIKDISREEIADRPGFMVIDATGKTILPGLIDMHAHLISGGFDTISEKSMSYHPREQQRVLAQMLYWGVAAVYDPVQPLESGLELRRAARRQEFPSPRLFISGPGFTAPGGWAGSMDPAARLQPRDRREVKEQVNRLADAGIDIVKIFYDDMSDAFASPLPKLDRGIMRDIIEEAHGRNLKVMVHTYGTEDHKDALRCGADIMAHSAITTPIDEEYVTLARNNRALYLGTLSIYHDVFDQQMIRQLMAEECVQRSVPRRTLETLDPGGPLDAFEATINQAYIKGQLPTIDSNFKKVYEHGISIGVGPDTGVPGAFPGISVHREMELMVEAGVPVPAVLVAATRTAAEYLGQESLGTIAVGKDAELIILRDDPLADIKNTRSIDYVIKEGRIVDRERLLEQIMRSC